MLSSEASSSLGCGLPTPQELRPSRRAVPLPPAPFLPPLRGPAACSHVLSPPQGPGRERRSRFSVLERTGLPPWTADLPAPQVLGGDPQRPPLCTLGSVACICLLTAPQYRLSVPASLGVQPRSSRAQALPGQGGRSEAEAVSPFVACFLTVCGGHTRAEGPPGSWPVPSFRCRLTREQQTLAQGRKITRPLPAPPGGRPVYLGSTNARRAAHAHEPPRPSDGLCSHPGPHPKSVLSQFSVRIMSLCSPGRQWAT